MAGAYAVRKSQMIIRRLLLSSIQVGSTHAEDLIRPIGRADLIANTLTERDEDGEKEREKEGEIWFPRQSQIHRRLN